MRSFNKKTPPKKWWQKLIDFLSSFTFINENSNFGGHEARMKERRRKTKFHK